MEHTSHEFLRQLLETPSPSGFEPPIQHVVRDYARGFADEVTTDRHGNVFAARFPEGKTADAPRVMLAGHCDQIALMVQHIDESGFLYVQPIGGWDMQILLGQNLTVWTKTGPVPGVVARRAIHLLKPEERSKVPDFTDVWVDIGAKNKEDAETLVRHGDPVTFALGYRPLRNGLAASPAMDDKVGLWVVMEAVRLLKGRAVRAAVYGVSTVAEEIGLRGATTAAYAIDPTVGIAVDVTHATDTPGNDKKTQGEIKLGAGPVLFRGPNISPRVFDLFDDLAKTHSIPVQVRGVPRATGTDANAIQISRAGVACGLLGIPNRYMHSPVEVVHLDDLTNAAKLLAEFCLAVGPETNWIP
ncbi:MAG TPA: M42 family metallopeptidase [Urbifossiella sp.]|jgi:endoglucanase|nr:M42 family metallopeptidase [Urbifossiella sp.]